jgi:hypothetical protein
VSGEVLLSRYSQFAIRNFILQSNGATGGIDAPPLGFGAVSVAGAGFVCTAGASAATGTEPVASTT